MTTLSSEEIKRDQLLAEGVNQLILRGYHRLNLKEILEKSDATKAFFYHYFKTKDVFIEAIIPYYLLPLTSQLETYLEKNKDDALSALIFYFDDLIHLAKQNNFKADSQFGHLIAKQGEMVEICRLTLKSAVEDYGDLLEQGLQLAQQQGVLRTDKSAKRMADLLIDGWQGALLRMKIEQSTVPLERCCDDLLNDYFKADNRR